MFHVPVMAPDSTLISIPLAPNVAVAISFDLDVPPRARQRLIPRRRISVTAAYVSISGSRDNECGRNFNDWVGQIVPIVFLHTNCGR